ncbi:MAG: DUF5666 domain-containing protein [Roseiarcus sp.]|jgi:hypothetical protein|uniref:DUF5666 domain-containing protein n=1 Tax=Roseiarcus sp. TaxID=1969460 RepID=UPI003C1FF734
MRSPLIAAALLLALSAPAWAQATPPAALRGIIERVAPDRESFDVKTRDGAEKTLRLAADAKVARVAAASLADVKPGVYVGVAAAPGDDGTLKALEVHIFPESMRGVGDGHRPFDLAPGSTMTNGAVNARVEQVDGPQIVVAYNGGQQTITVDKSTPIVAIEPGGLGDLMAGAAIVARGSVGEGGAYEARSVVVGVNGVTPPM